MKKYILILFLTCFLIISKAQEYDNLFKTDHINYNLSSLSIPKLPINSTYDLKNIINLNTSEYFRDYINTNYNTKLKKDIFIASEDFKKLQDSLIFIKKNIMGKYYLVNIKSESEYNTNRLDYLEIEKYDLKSKLKSIIISKLKVIKGSKESIVPGVFSSFYFPSIVYHNLNTTSSGTFNYLNEYRYIKIPLTVEKALEYDEQSYEAWVLYRFDGLTESDKIKSNSTKLFITIKDKIIYEKEFTPKNVTTKQNLPFIGKRIINFTNDNSTYIFKIDKLENIEIEHQSRNGNQTIYKGKFKNKIITKGLGFYFENDEVTFLTKDGNVQVGCVDLNSENLDEKPCIFKLTNGELR
jgi:hypothetical protein